MLDLYMYWTSELRLFMVQETLMFALVCFGFGVMCQWLLERLTDGA